LSNPSLRPPPAPASLTTVASAHRPVTSSARDSPAANPLTVTSTSLCDQRVKIYCQLRSLLSARSVKKRKNPCEKVDEWEGANTANHTCVRNMPASS
jgi:hypothetical protein